MPATELCVILATACWLSHGCGGTRATDEPAAIACTASMGPVGANQYVAIAAVSRDAIERLDLLHLDGLSLLDHPALERTADGRFEIAAYADRAAIATLCQRGCVAARGCTIRIVTSSDDLAKQWRQLD